ncbi:hypothetical protein [Emticicia soli]|uniref:Uncharacterized protein n=1 Tax=Emticicia soli TaxID=2027878 RepID=A0ABW5J701_9BACT
MAMIQNRQRNVKNISMSNNKHIAPRDTSTGNRDEAPDSRDIKNEVEKPKTADND